MLYLCLNRLNTQVLLILHSFLSFYFLCGQEGLSFSLEGQLMRDEFYYILRQCLLSRKDWVKYQSNYLRYQSLKAKADKRRFSRNIIISSIYSLINLPSTILNFLTKINQYSEYNRILAEIEVMEEEIKKYNNPQINKRRDDA